MSATLRALQLHLVVDIEIFRSYKWLQYVLKNKPRGAASQGGPDGGVDHPAAATAHHRQVAVDAGARRVFDGALVGRRQRTADFARARARDQPQRRSRAHLSARHCRPVAVWRQARQTQQQESRRSQESRSQENHQSKGRPRPQAVACTSSGLDVPAPAPAWVGDANPYVDDPGIDAAIPHAQRRSLLELTDDTCRWPVGDPCAADFFFCGAPPLPGKPYCAAHCARAERVDEAEAALVPDDVLDLNSTEREEA
jgi:hypothetical protein